MAREKRALEVSESDSSSSDEEKESKTEKKDIEKIESDWQKPEEYTDSKAEEPEPYTSMGCGFNPKDFEKLKLELDEEKKE